MTLTGHTKIIFSLTNLSNGEIVSGSVDQTIDGTNKVTLEGHTSSVLALVTNGDIVSGSNDAKIKIWKRIN
jgi:WD40 repeat protein